MLKNKIVQSSIPKSRNTAASRIFSTLRRHFQNRAKREEKTGIGEKRRENDRGRLSSQRGQDR